MAAVVAAPGGRAELCQLPLFDSAAALSEASRFHSRQSEDSTSPWVTWDWTPGGAGWREKAIPAGRLAWLVGQIATRPEWRIEHHYIVQNEFNAPNRRALHVWRFGLLWADLDLKSEADDARTVDLWTRKALLDCIELGIPEPSLIVWSGHGLHLKWVFDDGLSAQALPRWTAAMKAIAAKLESLGWPVDGNAMDVSRILRIAGTMNPKPDASGQIIPRPVYVVHEARDYSFDYLCEWLLPYTRAEVQRFREDSAARKAACAEWDQFEANRKAASAWLHGTLGKALLGAQEAEQGLHWHRLGVLRQVAAARGGIAPGERNTWTWIAANSLAWGLGDAGKLWLELPLLVREVAPTFSTAEVRASASSVYARLKAGGRDALYRLKTDTLVERLGLSGEETRLLRGRGHGTKNPGALGLEPLRNLPLDVWKERVRDRFIMGAEHATNVRPADSAARAGKIGAEARRQASADRRSQARLMRVQGMSYPQIAAAMSVSVSTAYEWCK